MKRRIAGAAADEGDGGEGGRGRGGAGGREHGSPGVADEGGRSAVGAGDAGGEVEVVGDVGGDGEGAVVGAALAGLVDVEVAGEIGGERIEGAGGSGAAVKEEERRRAGGAEGAEVEVDRGGEVHGGGGRARWVEGRVESASERVGVERDGRVGWASAVGLGGGERGGARWGRER